MQREGSSRSLKRDSSWTGSSRGLGRSTSGSSLPGASGSFARVSSSGSFRAPRLFSLGMTSSRQSFSDELLPVGDGSELKVDWDRFKADEQAIYSLSKLLSTYNEKRLEAARAGAAVTEAMLEYFPPERAHTRDAAATLHETHLGFVLDAEAAEAVNGNTSAGPVDGSFEDAVLAPVRAVEEKLVGVREMARSRNEMVAEIRRYENKSDATAAADNVTAQLTDAITRYCVMEKDIGEQCADVHENFEKLLDPVLEGFIRHESQIHAYGIAQLRQAQLDLEDIDYEVPYGTDINANTPVQRPSDNPVHIGQVTFPSERPISSMLGPKRSSGGNTVAPRQGIARPLLSQAKRPSEMPPVVVPSESSSEDESVGKMPVVASAKSRVDLGQISGPSVHDRASIFNKPNGHANGTSAASSGTTDRRQTKSTRWMGA